MTTVSHEQLMKEIENRKKVEENLQFSNKQQEIINSVLTIRLKDISLNDQLERVIKEILLIPWLLSQKGAIFLVEDDPGILVLKAHHNLPSIVQKMCANVIFGQCLCGRAAKNRRIEFADCVDERHDISYDGMEPHGHYCIPILADQIIIGVIVVYLKEGHQRKEHEEAFLISIASTLGGIIAREKVEKEKTDLQQRLLQAQKMEALGTLSAGISHEINTPIQFIGDNTHFLEDAFSDVRQVIEKSRALSVAVEKGEETTKPFKELSEAKENADIDYLIEETPKAISQILDGVDRVSTIVKSMKAFSHPDKKEMENTDLNMTIQDTLIISRNEYKYVADVETDFDPNLPSVPCYPHQLSQVFLNMIVNASHAIKDTNGNGAEKRGRITISTRHEREEAVIRISDTGTGIPEEIQHRIFEPFFTTKELGNGTGQGLSLVHSVITYKHKGLITFKTESGKGTTFIINLPLKHS